MEANESVFTLKMAGDGQMEAPAAFNNSGLMDTTPSPNNILPSHEEVLKKPMEVDSADPEPMVTNEPCVDHKAEQANGENSADCLSPRSPLLNCTPQQHPQPDGTEKAGGEAGAEAKPDTDSGQPHTSPVKESSSPLPQPPQPSPRHSATPTKLTPPLAEESLANDVSQSDGETKVEEVGSEGHHDKMDESTAEPLVEEPAEAGAKEEGGAACDQPGAGEAVSPAEGQESPQGGDRGVVISDVTPDKDKEESQHEEEKKTEEDVLMDHINSAYQCLEDFMKTKDEVKIKDCMELLTEIRTLTERNVESLKALTVPDSPELKGQGSKKSRKRGKSNTKVIKNSSRAAKNDVDNESDSPDPLEEVNLKDIKGLAVFAKWPNSGWFYPGVVQGLALPDLKAGAQNLRVLFYDGLEREMKSINILPAQLVPPTSVLFDLEEETDLTVASVQLEDNWVKFVFNGEGESDTVTKDFDKMAIKGVHMKTIKQSVDQAANKSENIVSGRRARGKSSVFNEDYVSSSPRSTEKRKSKVEDSKSTPDKAPAKRKSSSKDDESGDSTPVRSASKRRQVNGTKSTPRRASRK